ncbi:Random slug protein 5 [Paragonimus heterotremus]|uniref:Random slug protein 5 n=1 Tax=Paragonimus heterotremus TaxID=100268 RepID=A0A8J4TKP3_9TREM|nr:Random slug protein 5 [Paragonimus heterotremus]
MSSSSSRDSGKKNREPNPEKLAEMTKELRQLVTETCQPLPDEPDYSTNDKTLTRFIRARKFVLKDAFKQITGAIEWRRSYRPLHVNCRWCVDQAGYHGIRQIGFDSQQRPVFYACFAQCQTLKNTGEDTIAHVVYLVENAMKCTETGVEQWIIIVDCTGLTLPCCNHKIGRQFSQTFGSNYPEHLYRFFLVHHNPVLQGVWKAIRVFVDPNTVKKVKLVKKDKIDRVFDEAFGLETSTWLKEELRLNRTDISEAQRRFWEGPRLKGTHDPRGTQSYVKKYIEPLENRRKTRPTELLTRATLGQRTHLPHPNILQYLNETLNCVTLIDLKLIKEKPSENEMAEYGVTLEDKDLDEAESESEEDGHLELKKPTTSTSCIM